jgi:hypothetical protein
MKPQTSQSKGREPCPVRQLLESITNYPWRRNYKGDLCGANGQPVFFQGANAVIVEYAPMMLETLHAILANPAPDSAHGDKSLETIRRLAADMIADMERASADSTWCRGSVK